MKKKKNTNNSASKVKVLYQNLGGIWYAFSQVGEEVYFGRVPLNENTKAKKASDKEASSANKELFAH